MTLSVRAPAGIGAALLIPFLLSAAGPPPGKAHPAPCAGASVRARASIPNVQVSHDDFPAHAEPALAVNPRDPHNLLGAAMDFAGSPRPGTFVSFDGGRTWRDHGALPLPAGDTEGGDVSVAFSAQGTGFITAEAMNSADLQSRGVYVWRTVDGGRTFSRPVAVVSGQFVDHPWCAAAPAAARAGGALYAAWVTRSAGPGHAEGLAFSRSLDEGHRFEAARIISAPPGGVTAPVIAAGPAGAVCAAYVTTGRGAAVRGPDRPRTGRVPRARVSTLQVEVVASSDYGRHFGRAVVVGPTSFGLEPGPGLLIPTGPSLAVDPRSGALYLACAAARPGTPRTDILLRRSRDGGHTWGARTRVTVGPAAASAVTFQPQVVVGDAGEVAVSYLTLARGRIDVFLARSTTHGGGFGPGRRITPASFDPELGLPGGKEGRWWIGDYQGLAAGGGRVHPCWGDTRTGRLEIFTAMVPSRAGRAGRSASSGM